jgi:hypothetical protein
MQQEQAPQLLLLPFAGYHNHCLPVVYQLPAAADAAVDGRCCCCCCCLHRLQGLGLQGVVLWQPAVLCRPVLCRAVGACPAAALHCCQAAGTGTCSGCDPHHALLPMSISPPAGGIHRHSSRQTRSTSENSSQPSPKTCTTGLSSLGIRVKVRHTLEGMCFARHFLASAAFASTKQLIQAFIYMYCTGLRSHKDSATFLAKVIPGQ